VGVVFDSDTHAGTGRHRHRDRNSVQAKYKRRVGEERECSRSHLSEVRKGRGREGREGGRETGTSTEMTMTRGRRRSAAAATEVATGSAPKAGELTSSWTSISGLRAVTSPVYPRWDKPAVSARRNSMSVSAAQRTDRSISGLRAVTSPVYPRWDKPAQLARWR
jgi:hypothetical protein